MSCACCKTRLLPRRPVRIAMGPHTITLNLCQVCADLLEPIHV